MKKGLIITVNESQVFYEPERIREEAKKKGIDVDWWFYEDFELEINQQGVLWKNRSRRCDFSQYRWAIVRSSVKDNGVNHADLKVSLIRSLMATRVRVPNGKAFLEYLRFSKLVQHIRLAQAKVPVVPSQFMCIFNPKSLKIPYPVIVKNTYGSQGKYVSKAASPTVLRQHVEQYNPSQSLLQQFLPTGEDYRIIVIQGKAVGAMKRIAPHGQFISNISAGGFAQPVPLSSELKKLSETAAKLFHLDFCGVDIMCDPEGIPYVLEVNRHPQFQGFEKATGINVAEKLVTSVSGA